jgi:nicotinate-nucleotide adenylyltransferase
MLFVPVSQLAISATDIRAQLAAGRSPRFLLPDAVLDYIREEALYGVSAPSSRG